MTRPFWWTAECEAETSRPEDEPTDDEGADREAARAENDATKGW